MIIIIIILIIIIVFIAICDSCHAVLLIKDLLTLKVSVKSDDCPSEWKKIKAQNLLPHVDPSSGPSMALKGAKECGTLGSAQLSETVFKVFLEWQWE